MLVIEQMRDIRDGSPLCGFTIRNRQGKAIAIGAIRSPSNSHAFLRVLSPRYEHDVDLVRKCERLCGIESAVRSRDLKR